MKTGHPLTNINNPDPKEFHLIPRTKTLRDKIDESYNNFRDAIDSVYYELGLVSKTNPQKEAEAYRNRINKMFEQHRETDIPMGNHFHRANVLMTHIHALLTSIKTDIGRYKHANNPGTAKSLLRRIGTHH